MDLIHPLQSIYPDCELWNTQSLGVFKMDIFTLVGTMVHNHWADETLSIRIV